MRNAAMVALFVLTACGNATPAKLVDGLTEGMSEAQAITALNAKSNAVRVLFESSSPKSERRPAYSEKTITVADVACAGADSEVWLSFYMDKLRQVTCLPNDMNQMMDSLRSKQIVNSSKSQFEVSRPGVLIHGRFMDGRWGVSFTSKTLTREQSDWVRAYS